MSVAFVLTTPRRSSPFVRESLENEPLSFGASVEDDRALSLEFARTALADQEQAAFGSIRQSELCGILGLLRVNQ